MANYKKVRICERLPILQKVVKDPSSKVYTKVVAAVREHFPAAAGLSVTDEGLFLDLPEPVQGSAAELEAKVKACGASVAAAVTAPNSTPA